MQLKQSISNRFAPRRRCRAKSRSRSGAAVIETALLLPMLVLLAFGSIELANMVFMKQSLSIASYEGARAITKPGSTEAQANTRIQEVLASRSVTSYTVQYTTTASAPIVVSAITPRGTQLTVTVQSSNGGSNFGPLRLFTGRSLQCQTTMVRQ